jgi:hypothetical protein
MALLRQTPLLCLFWCVSLPAAPAAEPDWGEDKPLPIPAELQGLWAQGGIAKTLGDSCMWADNPSSSGPGDQ